MPDTKTTLRIIDATATTQSLAVISDSSGISNFHALTGAVAHDISSSLYYTQSAAQSLYELSGTLNKISQSVASGSVYNSTGSAQYLSIISGNVKDYTTALQNISSSVSSSLNIDGTSSAQLLKDISSSLGTTAIDYRPYITSSTGNITIANLAYAISNSLASSNTSSARFLEIISGTVADIANNAGQDYSTVLNDISSSLSSSLLGTTGNLYAGGKSAATWLSEISSSLDKISQSVSAGEVFNQISASLKAIDIDTTNISSSIVTTNAKLDTIAGHVDGIEGYVDGIEGKLTDISSSVSGVSSSVAYISQSTIGYASTAVVTKLGSSDFTSGIYQITGTTGGDTTPSNRVTVQILSKANNKLIYIIIGTQSVTFASSVPSIFSYEMTPSGAYYAFDADLRLPHRILTGSAFDASDYVLVTQTFR